MFCLCGLAFCAVYLAGFPKKICAQLQSEWHGTRNDKKKTYVPFILHLNHTQPKRSYAERFRIDVICGR